MRWGFNFGFGGGSSVLFGVLASIFYTGKTVAGASGVLLDQGVTPTENSVLEVGSTTDGVLVTYDGLSTPALNIGVVDTVLDGPFVIEGAVQRDVDAVSRYLLHTSAINVYYLGDDLVVDMNGVTRSVVVTDTAHHFVIHYDGTDFWIRLNMVDGAAVTHTFVGSGERFDASVELAPIGQLSMFRMWYGAEYADFDEHGSDKSGLGYRGELEEFSYFHTSNDNQIETSDGNILVVRG